LRRSLKTEGKMSFSSNLKREDHSHQDWSVYYLLP